MFFSSRNYAIGMAHYQIAGGHKVLAVLVGGYLFLAATILGLIVHANQGTYLTDAMRGTAVFLLVMQSFGVLFFGGGRIANCIRVDTMNNMLESHRLMPVSSWRVVLSYMFGTTSQLIVLLAFNALVMAGVEAAAHVSLEHFLISQVVLVFFAMPMWTLMTMSAFMFRQALGLMVFGIIGGGIASGALREFGILPGLSILETPLLGETIFNLTAGRVSFRSVYFIALPAQLAFSVLFFIGACRRYRGSYLTTFSVNMGIALVAVWGMLSAVSIHVWPDLMMRLDVMNQPQPPAQIVASLCVAALLLIVPVHALVAWEGVHKVSPVSRWLSIGAALAAALLPIVLGLDVRAQMMSVAVLGLHVLTLYAAIRLLRGRNPLTVGIWLGMLFAALWLGPLLAEVGRWILEGPESQQEATVISMLSPLGLLMRAWNTMTGVPPMAPGLIFQGIVTGVAWTLARRRERQLAAEEGNAVVAA